MKIAVMPLETLEIEFKNKTLEFRFDMIALSKMQSKYGDLEKLSRKYVSRPYDLTAIILSCGANIPLEESKVIVASSAEVCAEVTRLLMDSIGKLGGEQAKKKIQALVQNLQMQK